MASNRRRKTTTVISVTAINTTRQTIFLLACVALTAWIFHPIRGEAFSIGRPAPDIAGGPWINSRPLTLADLKGRIVLVEFWTYG